MKFNVMNLSIISLILLMSACVSKPSLYTDYDVALKAAQKQKKDVVLFFSRSDIDPSSQTLKQTIFDNKKFIEDTEKNFILANIDLPSAEGVLKEEQLKKNTKVAQRYFLQTLPTVLLITADGDVYGSIPYDESITTPEQYVEEINSYESQKVVRQALKDNIAKASGIEKAELIDELFNNTEESYAPLIINYIREIPVIDADNALGYREKYEYFIINQSAFELYLNENVKGAADVFLNSATSPYLNVEEQKAMYDTAISLYASLDGDNSALITQVIFKIAELNSNIDYSTLINNQTGIEKAKTIDELINNIDQNYQMFLGDYIKEVSMLDPDNTLGIRGKYELMNAYIDAQEFYTNQDMDAASQVFLKIVESPYLSPSQKQEAYQMAAALLPFEKPEDAEPIIQLLEKAISANPNGEMVSMLEYTIEQIQMLASSQQQDFAQEPTESFE